MTPFSRLLTKCSLVALLALLFTSTAYAQQATGSATGGSGSGRPKYEFYDDFERLIPFNKGILGRSDSGHVWGNRGLGTNAVTTTIGLRGRRLTYGSNAPGTFYAWASNSAGFAPKYWTKFGGNVSFEHTGRSSGLATTLGILLGDNHDFTGNFLHIGLGYNVFYVQRSLGSFFTYQASPLVYLDPAALNSNRVWSYSITIVSNTLSARIGPYKFRFTADDLYLYAQKPVILFQINGSVTNDVCAYYEDVFADYATESEAMDVLEPINWHGMTNWVGTGGGSTNFTILADKRWQTINAIAPVSIRAAMNYLTLGNVGQEWTLWIPNTSGADRTLEFAFTTNRWRFIGPTGLTNAPSVLTNNTATQLKAEQIGTNVFVRYDFFTLP